MTRQTLLKLLDHIDSARFVRDRMRSTQRAGGSGSSHESALNQELDTILELLGASMPGTHSHFITGLNLTPDDYTDKGKRVLNALDELEACKLSGSRSSIIHWAAVLVQASGDLAAKYLGKEAQDMIVEEATP